jgi:hypothetical protein
MTRVDGMKMDLTALMRDSNVAKKEGSELWQEKKSAPPLKIPWSPPPRLTVI